VDHAKRLDLLSQIVLNMDVAVVGPAVEECLAAGIPASRILADGLSAGMRIVGEKFKSGEIYMPEVLVSCDVYYRGLETLRPHIRDAGAQRKGKLILGTIHGDIHTVGKDVAIPSSRPPATMSSTSAWTSPTPASSRPSASTTPISSASAPT